jgi:hypothetical protein
VREVLLYDPARVPRHWTELMAPTDFAVFIIHDRIDTPLSAAGIPLSPEKATCVLFPDRKSADEFCAHVVSSVRGTRCEIYDKDGKAKPPLQIYKDPSLPKEDFPRSRWGWFLIVIGVAMLIYDATTGWDAIWPTAAGAKLILAGIVWASWNSLKALARKQRNMT